MLNLANLRALLSQVLSFPDLHTVVLFTPEGHLVSFAADAYKPKDDVRVIVGLSGEVWQETKGHGIGMVDSELGRLLVLPIERPPHVVNAENGSEERDPAMLLALNAEESVSWQELEAKARELANHLEQPVSQLRGRFSAPPVPSPRARPERGVRRET
ncbi:uncharacterized protein FIBRA_05905 [Fibroporia radiculosa]|uniref:Roadblock/LAMTOR2 domain-containing protein n=1 Tax=Fibroporia radiculosa TaxID=599839 RepID=J4H3S6_9APHY|nr:uncharacterized protein FIBRA_05905 [Fibroporia radiculosa]CCM03759.1 predicted protein [Fibroporia radiculosa]